MKMKRPAERDDTFNLEFGQSFKTMARSMMKNCNVGDTTLVHITDREAWERFLLED